MDTRFLDKLIVNQKLVFFEYNPPKRGDKIYTLGDVVINKTKRRVTKGGKEISMGGGFISIIIYMINSERIFVRSSELANHYFRSASENNVKAVGCYIHYIRKKLGKDFILTIKDRGYTINRNYG